MDIVPSTAPKRLTSNSNFSNDLLSIDAFSKIPKSYGMEKITTEEVMDKLDMFQSRLGKIDEFGFRRNFSKIREAIYLDGVQRIMPSLRSSFDVSGSGTSGNERKS